MLDIALVQYKYQLLSLGLSSWYLFWTRAISITELSFLHVQENVSHEDQRERERERERERRKENVLNDLRKDQLWKIDAIGFTLIKNIQSWRVSYEEDVWLPVISCHPPVFVSAQHYGNSDGNQKLDLMCFEHQTRISPLWTHFCFECKCLSSKVLSSTIQKEFAQPGVGWGETTVLPSIRWALQQTDRTGDEGFGIKDQTSLHTETDSKKT